MKACSRCGEVKPLNEFSKCTRSPDGLQYRCKACTNAVSAEWYERNKDRARLKVAVWREKNPEKYKTNLANWATRNCKKRSASSAKWRAAHPEFNRIYCHNRRARKREDGGRLSPDITNNLFKLQRGKCACGCKQPLGDDYHLDHIMPLALGGTNTDDNIQLLRAVCNMQKHAKHPIDFMQQKGFLL